MTTERVSDLYRRLGPTLYAHCQRILRDRAAAEDATQEVFLRVWRRAADLPPGNAGWAWVLRVATNYCLNVARDGRTHRTEALDFDRGDGTNLESAVAYRQLLEKTLEGCPEALREAAMLCYGEGIVHGRIAEQLGVSRRTVITRINGFRARAEEIASAA